MGGTRRVRYHHNHGVLCNGAFRRPLGACTRACYCRKWANDLGSHMFHTLQQAAEAEVHATQVVERAQVELDQAIATSEEITVNWLLDEAELLATIDSIRWHNTRWIFTSLLAVIAMAMLLTLMLLPAWLYNVLKNGELFGYHEEGATYVHEVVSGHRSRDERQPVMGWIILVLTLALLYKAPAMLGEGFQDILQLTRAQTTAITNQLPGDPGPVASMPTEINDGTSREWKLEEHEPVDPMHLSHGHEPQETVADSHLDDPAAIRQRIQGSLSNSASAIEAEMGELFKAVAQDEIQLDQLGTTPVPYVVAGTYVSEANARAHVDKLLSMGMSGARVFQKRDGRFVAIAQGPFASRNEAATAAASIKQAGIDAIVTDL